MYLQITTRCNMSCAHCGMRCTAIGEDMTLRTFRKALKTSSGNFITLGGGEPTLHPRFWQMCMDALGSDNEGVWLATNGSITKTALALARLAHKGVLGVALSRDDFHDPIDPAVVRAFTVMDPMHTIDMREIRDVSARVLAHGRALDNDLSVDYTCMCDDMVVKPNGDVWACGCEDAPVWGNVNTGYAVPDDWCGNCCHDQEPREATLNTEDIKSIVTREGEINL